MQNPLVRSDENIGMLPCLRQTSIEVPPSLPGYLKLTGLALSKSKNRAQQAAPLHRQNLQITGNDPLGVEIFG